MVEVRHAFVLMSGHARFVWNKALRLNLDRLASGVPMRYADLCWLLRLWKQFAEYRFLAEAHFQVLQQKLKDLDRVFADALDPSQPPKRMPRFKKKGRVACGHTEHADVNAAKVVLKRALSSQPAA